LDTTSLPTGNAYGLSVEMEDYIFQSRYFDLAGINTAVDPYVITVEMVPVPKAESPDVVYDTPVVLNNIFFETGFLPMQKKTVGRQSTI